MATIEEIDALVAPATPHFAYQIRARVRELVLDLPEDNPVRRHAEEKDGAARPARPRLVQGRRRAPGSAGAPRLEADPELGAGRQSAPVAALRDEAEHTADSEADELGARRCRDAEGVTASSVLVTGGSRGIGREVARRFAQAGAKRVAIGYLRNDAAAEEAAEELRSFGAEPVLVRGNVASTRVADEVAALGPLDAVVHCAATGVIRPALETTDKHFDWTLAANARAFLSLARAAAPQMPAGSSLVAVSSLGSTRVLENYVLVGTSKAALEALVRYLAVELAPQGIRVNAVSGGVVETGALDHFPNREQMLSASLARTPAGRLVEPGDVADAVAFLCSPEAEMIRGQTIVVDGGFSLVV